jgi:hypothetical protein
MPANGSSAAESRAETSTSIAVVPVTATVAPVAWLMAVAWSRMEVTRVAVAAADGALAGTTSIRAAVCAWFSCGGVTAATSAKPFSLAATASACCAAAAGSAAGFGLTSTSSGPL